jgi:glycosyltransferase involved in cell wall biosynthesis
MNNPFFSVIIPTFNRPDLLRESIKSVLDQTFRNFEIIVVDDHSINDIREIVASFKDNRIQYILNDHISGGAGTRNAGIFRAKGEWIAFLDDDDIWLKKKLELQYNKIVNEIDDQTGIIYTGFADYDFEKKREIMPVIPKKEGWIQDDILYTNFMHFSSVVIKASLLKKLGGLDEQFQAMQDMELYVRLAFITKVAAVKETLIYIRKGNSDRISINIQKKFNSILLFYSKYRTYIDKNPRIRHRISTLMLSYGIRLKQWTVVMKSLPWSFAGLFLDCSNFLRTIWGVILILIKSQKAEL